MSTRYKGSVSSLMRASLIGVGALVIGIGMTTLPFRDGWSCLSAIMFVPWFTAIRLIAERRAAWASVAIGGFLLGVIRSLVVCGGALSLVPSPLLVGLVICALLGLIHAVWSVALLAGMRLQPAFTFAITALLVPTLDWAITRPGFVAVPYITTAFASADTPFLWTVAWAGPVGLALFVGLLNAPAALSGRGAAVAIIAALLAVLSSRLIAPTDTSTTRTLRIGAYRGVWALKRAAPTLELVVVPESSAVDELGVVEDEDTVSLDTLRRVHDALPSRPTLVAGVILNLGDNPDDYRNSVLVRSGSGEETWRDKRIPAPGGEGVPLANLPIIGQILRRAAGVEGRMFTIMDPEPPARHGDVRFATAVCFEHALLEPRLAWRRYSADVDLLICVGRIASLHEFAVTELRLSRRARRLHAVLFGAPVVYVSDVCVEIVDPSGEVTTATYTDGGTTLEIELHNRAGNGVSIQIANRGASWCTALCVVLLAIGLHAAQRSHACSLVVSPSRNRTDLAP